MPCKCRDIFYITEKKSKIHFITQVTELIIKSSSLLKKLGIEVQRSENIISFDIENPRDFFEENFDYLNTNFHDLEKNEIKVFIENEENKLTLSSILSTKELNRYLFFIEDRSFFDIIENHSLTAYFQPIIDMHTNKIFAYETLTRGVLPNGDLMYPDILFSKSARNDK